MVSKLLEVLKNYADSDYLPMHMPGHKRRAGEIGNPYFIDLTEIEGFDNLHDAEGILSEAQKRAAKLYRSEETHYLINGSTGGILSAVAGCTSPGGTLLMARNCHKSVYHGAFLGKLRTRYLYPHSTGNLGINGAVLPEDVEKELRTHSEIQAAVITSPTYDGIVSDVKQIAGIVHKYGIPLIVDEAHGAHFPFSEYFPPDSISCGADVVIHSLHKTLPSLTQTALIHLNGSLIHREKIRKYLSIYQTSSPSYVLMASIDECVEWVRLHPEAFETFAGQIQDFRDGLQKMKRLKLLEVPGMDRSRIVVSVREAGIHGRKLADLLREKFHIETEMACSSYVCAITTVADTKESLERLKQAFLSIDRMLDDQIYRVSRGRDEDVSDEVIETDSVCSLSQAEEKEKEMISLKDAYGKVCGDFIMLYPPGIPLLAPGEIITEELIRRIGRYKKENLELQGIHGERILVLREER